MTRIAALGVWHEANSFATVRADRDQFMAAGVYEGPEIETSYREAQTSLSGVLEYGRSGAADIVPLWFSAITPMGQITADAFEWYCAEMLSRLHQSGPWDGVVLALHGAAVADSYDDADGELLARVRREVGPSTIIGVAVDMHANITQKMVDNSNVIVAYQTNPHIDARPRGRLTAELTANAIAGSIQPCQAYRWVPVVPTINRMGTQDPPMAALLRQAEEIRAWEGVLDVSVLEGHAYVNASVFGMSVIVISNGNRERADLAANELASAVWAARTDLVSPFPSPADAVELALRTPERPALLLDTGDNIGGGSDGSSVLLAELVIDRGLTPMLAIVVDPAAAKTAADAGLNAEVTIEVGRGAVGSPDGRLHLAGTVRAIHDGRYRESEVTVHAGDPAFNAGRTVALELPDSSMMVLTSKAVMPSSAQQVRVLGIDPSRYAAILAKGVHSPITGYGKFASQKIIVGSPGPTRGDYVELPYSLRPRPIFPFESADVVEACSDYRLFR